MCIFAGETEKVNARCDVVGFDSLGRCRLLIGEALPLPAAVARAFGFNAGGSSRVVASVVPHGSCPVCDAESEDGALLMPDKLTEENFTSDPDSETFSRRTLLSWHSAFLDDDKSYVRLYGCVLATIADAGGELPSDEESDCLSVQELRLSRAQMAAAWRRMLAAVA